MYGLLNRAHAMSATGEVNGGAKFFEQSSPVLNPIAEGLLPGEVAKGNHYEINIIVSGIGGGFDWNSGLRSPSGWHFRSFL